MQLVTHLDVFCQNSSNSWNTLAEAGQHGVMAAIEAGMGTMTATMVMMGRKLDAMAASTQNKAGGHGETAASGVGDRAASTKEAAGRGRKTADGDQLDVASNNKRQGAIR